MNKGDVYALFLRYVNQATAGGQALDETQSADYRDKFEYFLSPAARYLAVYRPVKAQAEYGEGDAGVCADGSGSIALALPGDAASVRAAEDANGRISWRTRGESTLIVPEGVRFPVRVFYEKKPAVIPPFAPDDTELGLDDDVLPLLALKCAALATLDDDAGLSAGLQSQFNQMGQALLNFAPACADSISSVMTMG